MKLIGYGVFSNEQGAAIRTGGYGGTSHSSKIYKHRATAVNVARKKKDCHVKELYVKDFADAVGLEIPDSAKRAGVIFP